MSAVSANMLIYGHQYTYYSPRYGQQKYKKCPQSKQHLESHDLKCKHIREKQQKRGVKLIVVGENRE
jgi:hypothetical protein